MCFVLYPAAMGPMVGVEEVVVVGEAKAMVSPQARVTASRVMEATTRALTAAQAPITKEDMAAMVNLSQVEGHTGIQPHMLMF